MDDSGATDKGERKGEMNQRNVMDRRIITVDQGNSSAKILVWQGAEVISSHRIFDLSIETLLPVLDSSGADSCVYCSVRYTDAKMLETLRRMLDGHLLVLTHSTPLPIGVRYGSRETLGNDRVAAAIGAAAIFPGEGCLVVDAGTAMTLDLVDPKDEFLGGNIAPGMNLRFTSLHEATGRLPLVNPEGEVPDFGFDTATAIRAGVIGGMVSEIADAFRHAEEEYGATRLVMTGNDIPQLLPLVEKRGLPVSFIPDLVGHGLMSVFYYNLISGYL